MPVVLVTHVVVEEDLPVARGWGTTRDRALRVEFLADTGLMTAVAAAIEEGLDPWLDIPADTVVEVRRAAPSIVSSIPA